MKKRPKFVIRRSAPKQFYGQYIAVNGKEVWRTSEVYRTKRAVQRAIDLLWYINDFKVDIVEDLD